MMTGIIGILFVLLTYGGSIAVAIFLLIVLSRFVKAFERMAAALEDVARKFRDNTKP